MIGYFLFKCFLITELAILMDISYWEKIIHERNCSWFMDLLEFRWDCPTCCWRTSCVYLLDLKIRRVGGGTEVAAGGKIKAFFSRRYINRTWQEIEAGWNIDHTASATRESFQEFDTRRMQMSKKWTTRRRLIQLKNKTALEKRMDRSKSESYIPSWKPRM